MAPICTVTDGPSRRRYLDQAAATDEPRVETAATPVNARSGRESWDATIVECSVQHGVVGVHDMLRSADRLVDTAATLSRRYALEDGGGGGHNRWVAVTMWVCPSAKYYSMSFPHPCPRGSCIHCLLLLVGGNLDWWISARGEIETSHCVLAMLT